MKKTLFIAFALSTVALCSSCKEEAAPVITVEPATLEVEGDGGTCSAKLTANCEWISTVENGTDVVKVDPNKGTGNTELTITVGENPSKDNTVTTINFAAASEPETAVASMKVNQASSIVVYQGVEYPTKRMADGRIWMTKNLQYIPEGMKVSDDPKDNNGIWYPNYKQTAAMTSADSIAKYGYLYDTFTAYGVKPEAVTAENYNTFEGKQGICPEGWHIPTAAEFDALVAAYEDEDYSTENTVYTSYKNLNAAGFNALTAGYIMKNDSKAVGRYLNTMGGHYIGSTAKEGSYKNDGNGKISIKNRAMMFYFKPAPKINVADCNFHAGCTVRCIKNK